MKTWKETWGKIHWEKDSQKEILEKIDQLLSAGADVNTQNKNGSTALILAANHGHAAAVDKLIRNDADVNVQNKWGWTALMCAAHGGYDRITQRLTAVGADVSLKNKDGNTAADLSTCETNSRAIIGQRVEKTSENPHGFQIVRDVPVDVPTVLVLTGSGTKERPGMDSRNSYKSANGYLSDVEKFLQKNGITQKVGLYAVIYNFGRSEYGEEKFDDRLARKKLFIDHHVPSFEYHFYHQHNPKFSGDKYVFQNADGRMVEQVLDKETLSPAYVDELFEKAFLFRLCDENGNKLPVDEACRRMRQVTVVAHCHGAYTFLRTEEKIQQKMKELGFSVAERARIQKELLCVACAPEAPLGVSKSTMISFASAEDSTLTTANNFSKFVHTEDFPASYFPGKRGEVFLAKKYAASESTKTAIGGIEHALLKCDDGLDELHTRDWSDFSILFSNAIANGVKNAFDGKPLPPVRDLVCGSDGQSRRVFARMKENGELVWQRIVHKVKMDFSIFRKYTGR